MDPVYVLLSVVIAMIAVGAKGLNDLRNKANRNSEGIIAVETKLDILLEIGGLDTHKVNRSIKEHMEELKQNGKPSIGCINIKALYRDKEG